MLLSLSRNHFTLKLISRGRIFLSISFGALFILLLQHLLLLLLKLKLLFPLTSTLYLLVKLVHLLLLLLQHLLLQHLLLILFKLKQLFPFTSTLSLLVHPPTQNPKLIFFRRKSTQKGVQHPTHHEQGQESNLNSSTSENSQGNIFFKPINVDLASKRV